MSQLDAFKALGLSDDLLSAISKKGFESPSAIQSLTIPHLLDTDKDIIAQAQTGTGKTAAFGLPIIQLLTEHRSIPQALVLVPTRELALQVTQELQSFNTHDLSIAPIYGGASIEEQLRRLRRGIDIVVGTPGRMLDHIRRRTLDLSQIAFLVLDEADEMLNMGFIEDIEAIMQEITSEKRVLLFSATMPDRIAALARNYMHDPDMLRVETKNITTDLTNQIYFEVREVDKFDALTRIIDVEPEFYGIVFSRTKVGVDEIVNKLIARGYAAEGLHGDISQVQREKILTKFKNRQVNILIATDVAARGIDVNNLSHVINYSLPQDSDSYVHRIGRTGRAGNEGTAITFISPAEVRKFGFLKRNIKADIKLEQLPTPADVIAIKRNRIKEDLYGIVESENYRECAGMAAELLERYSPEVALSALLRLAFKDELSENSYPEIRSIDVDRRGKSRVFMALGMRDGYDPRKIVKLLKHECGLSDHDVDDVKVMEDFAFATVPFDRANMVVRTLNMHAKGRPIAKIAKEKQPTARDDDGPRRRVVSRKKSEQSVPRDFEPGFDAMSDAWYEGRKPAPKKDVGTKRSSKAGVKSGAAMGSDSGDWSDERPQSAGRAGVKSTTKARPKSPEKSFSKSGAKSASKSFAKSAKAPKAPKAKKTTTKVSRRERKEQRTRR